MLQARWADRICSWRRTGGALNVDPLWVPSRLGVAEALTSIGQFDPAMEEYDQIARITDSDSVGASAMLQWVRLVYWSNRRREEAKRDWAVANNILDALEKFAPNLPQIPTPAPKSSTRRGKVRAGGKGTCRSKGTSPKR